MSDQHLQRRHRSADVASSWSTLLLVAFLLLLWLGGAPGAATPSVAGVWLTQDHEGVIAIEPCGVLVCARIVGVFLDRPQDAMPVDHRGISQCGLKLITDARQIRPNLWKGHITDPRNGSVHGVELHLDPNGNLGLRGFLGIPLLGRTQIWTRYRGTPPADCRIRPAYDAAPDARPRINRHSNPRD